MFGRIASSGWLKATFGAVVGGLAGVSMAGAQGAGVATVHACVTNSSGAISILTDPTGYTNPSQVCPATGAHVLDWNQAGPLGSQGPVGPPGSQGPVGPAGSQGPSGAVGRLDAATAASLISQLDAAEAETNRLVADLASERRQQSKLSNQERLVASQMPGYDIVLKRLRKLIGLSAVRQFFAPARLLLQRKPPAGPGWLPALEQLQMSFNLQYLQLQNSMQNENRSYTLVSNILKTQEETVKASINNIK